MVLDIVKVKDTHAITEKKKILIIIVKNYVLFISAVNAGIGNIYRHRNSPLNVQAMYTRFDNGNGRKHPRGRFMKI